MEFLYETHMHTSQVSACAKSSAEEQIRAYKERGYTGVIVTDHFVNGNSTCPRNAPWAARMRCFVSGYEKAKKEGGKLGLDVFLGWEFSINGLDFLTYGLDLNFLIAHPNLDKLPIHKYSALVRSSGGYIAQAHPYRAAWYIDRGFPVDSRLLDGVEVFNGLDTFKENAKAYSFAEQHDLPMQAGSDCHSANHLLYSGIALKRKADDIHDIIRAIKEKKVRTI